MVYILSITFMREMRYLTQGAGHKLQTYKYKVLKLILGPNNVKAKQLRVLNNDDYFRHCYNRVTYMSYYEGHFAALKNG
jgi:hypothetical protein